MKASDLSLRDLSRPRGRLAPGSAIRQVLTLAAFTWKEGLRRRMVLVGMILTLAFVVLYGLGGYFAFHVMLSMGVFMATILTVTMLVFSASGMISGDAENGTLQTIVTRPLARYHLLLGRYLGFASIFLAYLIVVTGLLVGLTRAFSGFAPPAPVQAIGLIALQGLILLALASVGTTVLPPLATGVLVFMGYGVAFIGGVVGQIGGLLSNHVAQMIGTVVSFLVPSDLLFRGGLHGLAPSIPTELAGIVQAGPFGNASPVSGPMLVYCFGYPVVALTAACWLFSRKDL